VITTQEEARRKWCPFVRVEGNNRLFNTATDGFVNTTPAFHCIGPECMAWRVLHFSHAKTGFEESLHEHGYCGLAGRPEFFEGT
jgi:hypothetical protein